jgi:hypothetical protein
MWSKFIPWDKTKETKATKLGKPKNNCINESEMWWI